MAKPHFVTVNMTHEEVVQKIRDNAELIEMIISVDMEDEAKAQDHNQLMISRASAYTMIINLICHGDVY